MTFGFHLAAVSEETLRSLRRLTRTCEELRSPLGAGAMTGQELPWDLDRMAALLGFPGPQPHALVAVASRGWTLALAGDLIGHAVAVSRFTTDLMLWGSGEFGYIDLPDELCGISSAMPQKRNFPILERIRGRTGHVLSFGLDLAVGQRGTPYSNMVEVSKEAGAHLRDLVAAQLSAVRLLTLVLANLRPQAARARAACEREYLGGFSLANLLSVRLAVPWRSAQVVAGRYVTEAIARGRPPAEPDGPLLAALLEEQGHHSADPEDLLRQAFSVDRALTAKTTPGSANPTAVRHLLAAHAAEYDELEGWLAGRRAAVADALRTLDDVLTGGGSAT